MSTSSKLLPVHKRFDITFARGEGAYLFDENGKKYLDFGAGIAVNALGHCHPKMVATITSQAKKLWHVSNIYNVSELNNYAEKITKAAGFDYVFFCNSGAEAVECAIKMIRRHFYVQNQPQKNRIITFIGAFHGRTIATISAAGKKKYLEGFEPALPGFDNIEFGNIEAVRNAITENTAGILIEPIQGEGGVHAADKKFLQELRKLADEKNLLLAFDEVQCGMGRLGKLFAADFYSVKPDIIASAKGIAGGFPLGACLATKSAANGMSAGMHGTTYGGNPMAMALADAVLTEILSEGFLENVRHVAEVLKTELTALQQEFPKVIEEIRGVGFMIGIKIKEGVEGEELVKKFMANGLLSVPANENVIRLLPPLIATVEQAKEAIEKIRKSLN